MQTDSDNLNCLDFFIAFFLTKYNLIHDVQGMKKPAKNEAEDFKFMLETSKSICEFIRSTVKARSEVNEELINAERLALELASATGTENARELEELNEKVQELHDALEAETKKVQSVLEMDVGLVDELSLCLENIRDVSQSFVSSRLNSLSGIGNAAGGVSSSAIGSNQAGVGNDSESESGGETSSEEPEDENAETTQVFHKNSYAALYADRTKGPGGISTGDTDSESELIHSAVQQARLFENLLSNTSVTALMDSHCATKVLEILKATDDDKDIVVDLQSENAKYEALMGEVWEKSGDVEWSSELNVEKEALYSELRAVLHQNQFTQLLTVILSRGLTPGLRGVLRVLATKVDSITKEAEKELGQLNQETPEDTSSFPDDPFATREQFYVNNGDENRSPLKFCHAFFF